MTPELEALERLKPCPFCKEAKELNTIPQHGEWFAGWCSRCDAVGPLALTKELAIATWNTRADSTPRPWLRAEEVVEPGWYWERTESSAEVVNLFSSLTGFMRRYCGEATWHPLRVDGAQGVRYQRIPEPELPEEES